LGYNSLPTTSVRANEVNVSHTDPRLRLPHTGSTGACLLVEVTNDNSKGRIEASFSHGRPKVGERLEWLNLEALGALPLYNLQGTTVLSSSFTCSCTQTYLSASLYGAPTTTRAAKLVRVATRPQIIFVCGYGQVYNLLLGKSAQMRILPASTWYHEVHEDLLCVVQGRHLSQC
jgi:hypothetical protein